eukprot:2509509-Rhodomonas_salina.1
MWKATLSSPHASTATVALGSGPLPNPPSTPLRLESLRHTFQGCRAPDRFSDSGSRISDTRRSHPEREEGFAMEGSAQLEGGDQREKAPPDGEDGSITTLDGRRSSAEHIALEELPGSTFQRHYWHKTRPGATHRLLATDLVYWKHREIGRGTSFPSNMKLPSNFPKSLAKAPTCPTPARTLLRPVCDHTPAAGGRLRCFCSHLGRSGRQVGI